jgi:hypothetical protein
VAAAAIAAAMEAASELELQPELEPELEPESEPEAEAEVELKPILDSAAVLALMAVAMERAKASARQASPVFDEPEEPKDMRWRNARARPFVVHEAGVKSDDIKTYDRGRRKRHTHTHILAS